MREIKFRAWNGEMMSEPFYPWELIPDEYGFNDKHGVSIYWEGCKPWMQYTGLKDRHGEEIYEGDVVDDGQKWIVKYNGCAFMPWGGTPTGYYPDKMRYPSNFTVIGNIYESPDLVKK